MEWHFSQTPYHYCLNNPIKFIDPFGLDTLRVNPDGLPEADIDPVTITHERPNWLQRMWRRFKRATSEATASERTYTETPVDDGIYMDWWRSDKPWGNHNVIERDNPNWDKIFNRKGTSTDQPESSNSPPSGTSDKDIKQATGDNTDANGRPIQETTQSQGQESDSVVVQHGVYFTDDSVLVQDYKRHVKSNQGRNVSKPYWKKWSNPFK
jgi:hypothetical protein